MRHFTTVAILSLLLAPVAPIAIAEPLDLELLLPKDETTPVKPAPETDADATAPEASTVPAAPVPQPVPALPAEKTSGDVLTLPTPAPQTVTTTLPGRGMKMADVEARFGAPLEKGQAVGKPPITRWTYPEFYVVFERDIVLHAVLKTAP